MGSEPKPRVNFSRRGASAKRWRGEREGDVGSIGKPPLSKSGFPGSNPGVPENKIPQKIFWGTNFLSYFFNQSGTFNPNFPKLFKIDPISAKTIKHRAAQVK